MVTEVQSHGKVLFSNEVGFFPFNFNHGFQKEEKMFFLSDEVNEVFS